MVYKSFSLFLVPYCILLYTMSPFSISITSLPGLKCLCDTFYVRIHLMYIPFFTHTSL